MKKVGLPGVNQYFFHTQVILFSQAKKNLWTQTGIKKRPEGILLCFIYYYYEKILSNATKSNKKLQKGDKKLKKLQDAKKNYKKKKKQKKNYKK